MLIRKIKQKTKYPLHKKRSFPLRVSSVNVTKSTVFCGFGHIYWRNPYRKTSFFLQWSLFRSQWTKVSVNVIWLFNSQYPLNWNLTKSVLYINRFKPKVIGVESGMIKFIWRYCSLKTLPFHSIRYNFHFIKQKCFYEAKSSFTDK